VAAREYVDRGVSGAKDRRPALDQLVADAKRRRYGVMPSAADQQSTVTVTVWPQSCGLAPAQAVPSWRSYHS